MATLVLTASEVAEVRQMAGNRLTAADVSDALITGDMVLGAASDYVFEAVRASMDLSKLSPADRAIAERFYDEADDDIANFVNQVLKPPQRSQMRRSVMYRSVGNLIVSIQQVGSERAGLVQQTLSNVPTQSSRVADWTQKRDHFYALADDELRLLGDAFGDDAFGPRRSSASYTLFSVVNN